MEIDEFLKYLPEIAQLARDGKEEGRTWSSLEGLSLRLWGSLREQGRGHAKVVSDHSFKESPRYRIRKLLGIRGKAGLSSHWHGLLGIGARHQSP